MPSTRSRATTAAAPVAPPRRRVAGARRRPADEDVAVRLGDRDPVEGAADQPGAVRAAALTEPAAELAEPVEPAEATGADAAEPEPAAVRRHRLGLVPTVLAACLVAVLAACALAAVTTRRDRADASAGPAALAVARTSAATILSYDYRHLPADFAAASALTTGSFRADYQATTAKAVSQLATQTKAVVVAKVAAGGVVSSTRTRVVLLLFVDQTTTSNRLDAAKIDEVRVQLTMTKVGGHWLVSALQAL